MLITLPFCKVLDTFFFLYLNDLLDDAISNIWPSFELSSELEPDLKDTAEWDKKYLVTFNAGKTQQKQPFRGVFIKRCSENMQQIYRRTPMLKCDFNKVTATLLKSHFSMGVLP